MAMDALTLELLCNEIRCLCQGKITRVTQPERDEIVLSVFASGKTHNLLISTNAGLNRIHLTRHPYQNPKTAFGFCMLLRKHLTNAVICSITQMPYERVLDFLLNTKNELGYESKMHLICEFTAKTANVILTDEKYLILDCIKHLPQDIESDRVILNGACYRFFKPQSKVLPFDYDAVRELLRTQTPFSELLRDNLLGVSKRTVAEILWGIEDSVHNSVTINQVVDSLKSYREKMSNLKPCILFNNGEIVEVLPFPYDSAKGELLYFDTLCSAHDEFYFRMDKQQRFKNKSKSAHTIIKNAVNRTQKKIAIQMQSLLDAQSYEVFRKYCSLILANQKSIKKGATSCEVTDFFTEECEPIVIPLDKELTASENAQKYIKKYQKLRNSITHNTTLLQENKKTLTYLQSIQTNLSFCTDNSDLEQIYDELSALGLLKEHVQGVKKDEKPKLLKYVIEGKDVYVGKNNVQNDYITFKLGKPSDLWLHAQGVHSSHCLISNPQNEKISDSVIVTVSEICAYYSNATESGKVEIAYTEKRNVKKPSKSPLGFVNYTSYTTVWVKPNSHSELLINTD